MFKRVMRHYSLIHSRTFDYETKLKTIRKLSAICFVGTSFFGLWQLYAFYLRRPNMFSRAYISHNETLDEEGRKTAILVEGKKYRCLLFQDLPSQHNSQNPCQAVHVCVCVSAPCQTFCHTFKTKTYFIPIDSFVALWCSQLATV